MRDPLDPKRVIAESFRIEGITEPECRALFFDWALGLPEDADSRAMVAELVTRHADEARDHPMMVTLQAALAEPPAKRRRGGRAARLN